MTVDSEITDAGREQVKSHQPIRSPVETQKLLEGFRRQYHPCVIGLHVCGFAEEAEHGEHVTFRNYVLPEAIVRSVFEKAKAELGETEDSDFLVDLCIGDSMHDDFWMTRQMLDRLDALVTSELATYRSSIK